MMDHMMKTMEKYSENLEKMVQSRTQQLREERRRADDLLARMLPRFVEVGAVLRNDSIRYKK